MRDVVPIRTDAVPSRSVLEGREYFFHDGLRNSHHDCYANRIVHEALSYARSYPYEHARSPSAAAIKSLAAKLEKLSRVCMSCHQLFRLSSVTVMLGMRECAGMRVM